MIPCNILWPILYNESPIWLFGLDELSERLVIKVNNSSLSLMRYQLTNSC